jgi:hypothetical protein
MLASPQPLVCNLAHVDHPEWAVRGAERPVSGGNVPVINGILRAETGQHLPLSKDAVSRHASFPGSEDAKH